MCGKEDRWPGLVPGPISLETWGLPVLHLRWSFLGFVAAESPLEIRFFYATGIICLGRGSVY